MARSSSILSFVARESSLTFTDEGTQTTKTETAPKRFTYYLGPDEACRTASERLALLAHHQTEVSLAHVIEAFSVEKLNKEFFDAYRNHYRLFCDHLLAGEAPVRVFGLVLDGLEGKARDRALKPVRDFVKKLLGRIVSSTSCKKKPGSAAPLRFPPGAEEIRVFSSLCSRQPPPRSISTPVVSPRFSSIP